jgi:hypothetical protein
MFFQYVSLILLPAHDTVVLMLFTVRFVPSWFPGASFKRNATVWRYQLSELDRKPHAWAKEQIVCILKLVSVTL